MANLIPLKIRIADAKTYGSPGSTAYKSRMRYLQRVGTTTGKQTIASPTPSKLRSIVRNLPKSIKPTQTSKNAEGRRNAARKNRELAKRSKENPHTLFRRVRDVPADWTVWTAVENSYPHTSVGLQQAQERIAGVEDEMRKGKAEECEPEWCLIWLQDRPAGVYGRIRQVDRKTRNQPTVMETRKKEYYLLVRAMSPYECFGE